MHARYTNVVKGTALDSRSSHALMNAAEFSPGASASTCPSSLKTLRATRFSAASIAGVKTARNTTDQDISGKDRVMWFSYKATSGSASVSTRNEFRAAGGCWPRPGSRHLAAKRGWFGSGGLNPRAGVRKLETGNWGLGRGLELAMDHCVFGRRLCVVVAVILVFSSNPCRAEDNGGSDWRRPFRPDPHTVVLYHFDEGRGERLKVLEPCSKFQVLLVFPGFPIATSWVYQNLRLKLTKRPNNISILRKNLSLSNITSLGSQLYNDLESVVIQKFPEVKVVKDELWAWGALGVLLSGSGSTVFGIFDDPEKAQVACASLKGDWERVVTETIESFTEFYPKEILNYP